MNCKKLNLIFFVAFQKPYNGTYGRSFSTIISANEHSFFLTKVYMAIFKLSKISDMNRLYFHTM